MVGDPFNLAPKGKDRSSLLDHRITLALSKAGFFDGKRKPQFALILIQVVVGGRINKNVLSCSGFFHALLIRNWEDF